MDNRMRLIAAAVGIASVGAVACGQSEIKKLLAGDGAANAQFGIGTDLDGDTLVIGANQDSESGANAGAAYVFERNLGGPNAWGQTKKLTPIGAAALANFGVSVAIDGDTIVIGAFAEEGFAGAAYVFERNLGGPDNWGEAGRLTSSDRAGGDTFGTAVDIDGDLVVVGASGNASNGAAYLFERDFGGAANWGEIKKLVAADGNAGDFFGRAVAISAGSVIAGAYNDSDAVSGAGSAYVFDQDQGGPGNWGEAKKLIAGVPGSFEYFGWSVEIDADLVIVAARDDGDNGSMSGSAFIFSRDQGGAGAWGQVMKLLPDDGSAGAQFGYDVWIGSNVAAVGAYGASGSGLSYLFGRDKGGAGQWGQIASLEASDPDTNDLFGGSVAVSGDLMIIGAFGDDESANNAGAAYVFGGVVGASLQGDCNGNGQNDLSDVLLGVSADCNDNLIPDECDILNGTSVDADMDGVPDECCQTPCVAGDLDGDGDVDVFDFGIFAPSFGEQCAR